MRHKWTNAESVGTQYCERCQLWRKRPLSRLRRGRLSVSDWDYWIDGQWHRLQTVPSCGKRLGGER